MIPQKAFVVEPWAVREVGLDLKHLAQSESVFALSNGHIGFRANLEEGEPHGLPGTYLNSFFELRPLPYAEAGFGYPESGQTVINVTNGKLIRLLVDDEPFDVRYGTLRSHERVLDLRAGVLRRDLEWVSPAGKAVRIHSTRLVSFQQRSIAAIRYEVEALDAPVRLVLQSELVTNEDLPPASVDPRVSAMLADPLISEVNQAVNSSLLLIHRTRHSDLRMAAICDHEFDGPESTAVESQSFPDLGRVTVTTELQPGERFTVVKYLAYGWSSQRSLPAIRDQVVAALTAAKRTGWDGLVASQRSYLDTYWDNSDVEVDGDADVQQAVRFALWHVLQSGARAEGRAIPAKGLTGPGYDGHAFWDTECFVLPVLSATLPVAAADALMWRHSTLDLAQERAEQLGLRGAAFPWRTIRGHECSAYWPAGTAAFHVNADIALAAVHYIEATGDEAFERGIGVDLLVNTARLWRSLGHHDRHGAFRIDGVTGPDEYSAVADNNVFTNLMAQRNLRAAAEVVERLPDEARRHDVGDEEAASWREAADAMVVPYDVSLGVHPQSEGFTDHEMWDFAGTPACDYPLLLHYPYVELYRKQVVKQADLVLSMYLCGEAFTAEQKARNVDYYERITVRDSSLSACVQAIMAAETGHLDLAYDYLGEAALMDLDDLEQNTRDGVHVASLAGAWLALVAGFGGMRIRDRMLLFYPQLPPALSRLAFRVGWRGRLVKVEVTPGQVTYRVDEGSDLQLWHDSEVVTVPGGGSLQRPVPAYVARPRPRQPAGRVPARRGGSH